MRLLIFFFLSILIFGNNLDEWERHKRESEKNWSKQKEKVDLEWKEYNEKIERDWNKHISELNELWGEAVVSTRKQWIKYSSDKKTYAEVNFDEKDGGYIILKTLADNSNKKKAEFKLEKQLRKIELEKDPYTQKYLLEGMVDEKQRGKIKEEKSKNGKKMYSMRVGLKKNHFEIRRERYRPLIEKKAKKIGVKPELVMAVVHSESSFNPKARSNAGAYGLMQLIPQYGAKEGYEYLYKRKKLIKIDELYDPDKNIEYGTAYLKRLDSVYFKDIKDETKRKYLVIASYNWGPGIVKRKITGKTDVDKDSKEKLYRFIKKNAPQETANYLDRVTTREMEYKKYF